VRLHAAHRSDIFRLFQEDPELSWSTQNFNSLGKRFFTNLGVPQEPVILADTSSLLSVLLQEYVPAFAGGDRAVLEDALKAAIDSVAADLVAACMSQIRGLGQVVFAMLQERQVVAEARRIVLVELPVGNSIPIKVLRHFLAKRGCSVEVLRISLSRNDSLRIDEKTGKYPKVTRKQLLREHLTEALGPRDVVIYLDEWLTGSNFKNISEQIASILRGSVLAGTSFLPVAMLTSASHREDRYLSYVRKHNKLVQRFGFGSENVSRFRVEFPPLDGDLPRRGYFFWAEHDWMAGYRKIQPLGMASSIIDVSVERLMSSPRSWPNAVKLFLARMIRLKNQGDGRIPDFPPEAIEDPESSILASYEDYKDICREIRAVDHPTNFGRDAEPIEMAGQIGLSILNIIKDRPAKLCVGLGLSWGGNTGERAFKKRGVYEEHVPVIAELEPPLRWFHDRLTQRIVSAIEERGWSARNGGR